MVLLLGKSSHFEVSMGQTQETGKYVLRKGHLSTKHHDLTVKYCMSLFHSDVIKYYNKSLMF